MLPLQSSVSELPKFWAATFCLNPDFLSYERGNSQNSLLWVDCIQEVSKLPESWIKSAISISLVPTHLISWECSLLKFTTPHLADINSDNYWVKVKYLHRPALLNSPQITPLLTPLWRSGKVTDPLLVPFYYTDRKIIPCVSILET